MPAATPKPVYAIVGDDNFLQVQALLKIVADQPAGTQRIDLDGERAELHEVLDELRSFSMFSAHKLVVVRDGDALITRFRELLEKYLQNPSSSATLVLRVNSLPSSQRIYKAIQKVGQIQQVSAPKDLVSWVVERARTEHQLTLAPDAARRLAERIGADLGRMDNELAKLALQHEGGRRISAEQIDASVAFQREQKMWDMTNELAAGHVEQALRRWRQLVQLDSSTEYRAVTWLTLWLENVRKALALLREGTSPAAVCQQLKIWPRQFQQPFINTAQSLGEAGVRRAIDLLAEVDRQSKSGVGDAATNVERFMLSLHA